MGNDKVPKSAVKTKQAAYEKELNGLVETYNQLGDRLTRLSQESQQISQQRNQVGMLISKAQGSIEACKKVLGEKVEEPKKEEKSESKTH